MTLSRTEAQELLERHGLEPSRSLGQNFVVDPNTVRKIARLAGVGPGDRVVEIGPGLGALTLALLETGASVTAIEIDRHLIPVLEETLAGTAATVHHADAMTVDWPQLLGDRPWTLVANLPYNVAVPLVLDIARDCAQVTAMLVMVQREVAERLAAGPGSKTYGIPSVKLAFHFDAEVAGIIGSSVFLPRPRVESALVRAVRRAPAGAHPADTFALVERAFGQRRKMLRRSLREVVTDAAFEMANIDPQRRPEELSVTEWVRLTEAIAALADQPQ